MDIRTLIHDLRNSLNFINYWVGFKNRGLADEAILTALDDAIKLTIKISDALSKNNKAKQSVSKYLPRIVIQDYLNTVRKNELDKLRTKYKILIKDTYDLLDEEKVVYFNPSEAESFRENVLSNAVNAGATKVYVTYKMHSDYLVIAYSDNGSGMTQDEVDRLHAKKHGDGIIHGIGTSSMIKSLHDYGFFVHYSSTKGEGTNIRFVVPYAEE